MKKFLATISALALSSTVAFAEGPTPEDFKRFMENWKKQQSERLTKKDKNYAKPGNQFPEAALPLSKKRPTLIRGTVKCHNPEVFTNRFAKKLGLRVVAATKEANGYHTVWTGIYGHWMIGIASEDAVCIYAGMTSEKNNLWAIPEEIESPN